MIKSPKETAKRVSKRSVLGLEKLKGMLGGQSLMVQLTNASLQRNAFEAAFKNNGEPYFEYLNVADGGSFISDKSSLTDSNTWWRLDRNTPAESLRNAMDALNNAVLEPNFVLFNIGQSEANALIINSTEAEVEESLEKIFSYIRAFFGEIDIYINMIGQLNPGATGANGTTPDEPKWQMMRDILWRVIKKQARTHLGIDDWDLERQDKFHITEGAPRAEAATRSGNRVMGHKRKASVPHLGPQIVGVSLSGSNRILAQCELEPGTIWNDAMNHFSNGQCNFDQLAGFRSIIQVFKNSARLEPNSIRHFDGSQEVSVDNNFRVDFDSGTFSSGDQIDVYIGYDWLGIDNEDGTYDLLQEERGSQSNLIKDSNNLPLRTCHWQRLANETNFTQMNPTP